MPKDRSNLRCARAEVLYRSAACSKTLEVAFRNQLHEILVALFIFAKNDQMIRPAAAPDRDRSRLVFAIYISQPMIGLTPAFFAAS